jgi:hypothetical protein
MSCCGNKRSQWNRTDKQVLERASPAEAWRDSPQAVSQTERAAPIKENAPRVFEYLGRSSLVVTGASSRRLYHFAYPGHRLEIEYGDSFAIMAEGELKRV